jgi:chromosome segregation ATPase
MVDERRRFEAIRGLEALSPLGQQAVLDARVRLDIWIDENLDRIEAEMNAAIESKRRALGAETDGLRAELAAARAAMSDLLAELGSLEERFSSGDGMTLEDAVRATREIVMSVRSSLEAREQRVHALAPASAGYRATSAG